MKTTLALYSLLILASAAQTLTPSDADLPIPVEDPAVVAPATADPELINTPSRNVGLDVEAYVNSVLSSLDMRNRKLDPFGRYQDPAYKPIQAPQLTRHATRARAVKIPLSDHIRLLPISMVNPAGGEFLIAASTYRVGDVLKLKTSAAEPLRVKVLSIRTDSVTFEDLATGETAAKDLTILPDGMSRGGEDIHPPGLVPKSDDHTIDLTDEDPLSQR